MIRLGSLMVKSKIRLLYYYLLLSAHPLGRNVGVRGAG